MNAMSRYFDAPAVLRPHEARVGRLLLASADAAPVSVASHDPAIRRRIVVAAQVLAAALVAACGGGGSDSSVQASGNQPVAAPAIQANPSDCPKIAAGQTTTLAPRVTAVVGGVIEKEDSRRWAILVSRDDGATLVFYGPDASTVAALGGYVYTGYPWHSGTDPTVFNGSDWGTGDAACLIATVDTTTPALSGSLSVRNSSKATLQGGAIPGSSYSFNQPASLAAAVGDWRLAGPGLSGTDSFKVAADGSLDGTYRGCKFTGTMSASPTGKGAFDVLIQYASGCGLAPELPSGMPGFAIPYTPSDGAARLLLYADTNNGVDFENVMAIAQR